MAFELATVTGYLAGLTVTGKTSAGASKTVTVLDWSTLKESADHRLCPLFQPDITQQIALESLMRESFGSGGTAKQTLIYTVPYVLLFAPVGESRGLTDVLPNLVETVTALVTAIITHDTPSDSSVDLSIATLSIGQTVSDAAGNPFHGAQIGVRITEYI